MADTKLFEAGIYEVSANFISQGAKRYPADRVTSVSDFQMGLEFTQLLIFGAICIAALASGQPVVMLLFGGGCGFLVYRIITRRLCVVIVEFQNGEKIQFETSNKEQAIAYRDAVYTAMGKK